MKVLLDHDLPAQLRLALKGHLALTARSMGWDTLTNGRLLACAEEAGFDVLVTGDQGILYQQNHAKRRIALVVLSRTARRALLEHSQMVIDALARASPGSYQFVPIEPGPIKGER